jgi:hypothetical protein
MATIVVILRSSLTSSWPCIGQVCCRNEAVRFLTQMDSGLVGIFQAKGHFGADLTLRPVDKLWI